MQTTRLNLKNRLISMLLDHTITTFILFLLEAPVLITKILAIARMLPLTHAKNPLPTVLLRFTLYDVVVFSLYFNKDIFLGQSIAKRILGFRVFNNKTGQPAGPFRCLVRNFTLLLWPIEVFAALFNTERRIGDYIAGTRFGVNDPGVQARPNWIAMAICIPIAACFTYAVWFYPFELLVNALLAEQTFPIS